MWRKGSEASYGVWRDDSGLFSWPCRKKGPHLAMTGASRGFSPAAAPVSDFSRGTTGSSESLSCGARVCSMIRICRYQKGLISFGLLWLVCNRRRLIIPRYTKETESMCIRIMALNKTRSIRILFVFQSASCPNFYHLFFF